VVLMLLLFLVLVTTEHVRHDGASKRTEHTVACLVSEQSTSSTTKQSLA